jgi:hypothetical protein
MPKRLQQALQALGLLALVFFAHGPLLSGGWRAPDLALFQRAAATRANSVRQFVRADPTSAPLAMLERSAVAKATSAEPSPGPRRALALVLLGVAALGTGASARRLLLPWTGPEHAGAAGFAVLLLAATHPLGSAWIAAEESADELRALAAGAVACALFLKSRQERRFLWTLLAFGLTLLACLEGELGLGLPVVLLWAELVSGQRYRPRRERWRTGLNTLFFFGLAALAAAYLWLRAGGLSHYADGLELVAADPAGSAQRVLGRVGCVLLPANPSAGGLAAALAAGVALILALEPALFAARSAPRLWCRILFSWLVFLAAASLYGLGTPVAPGEPAHAALLGASVLVHSVGLGSACTALSGLRRELLPWLLGAVQAVLALQGALAWNGAAAACEELALDLAAAHTRFEADSGWIVLDAPEAVRGVETLGGEVAALIPEAHNRSAHAPPVLALSSAAFLALASTPELALLRGERMAVLLPLSALPGAAGSVLRPGGARQAVRLGPPAARGSRASWRGPDARSPDLDLDTFSYGYLSVRAAPESGGAVGRTAAWRVDAPEVGQGAAPCVWIDALGEPLLVADLGASLAWRLGDRVRRVWIEGGATSIIEAELSEGPPPFERLVPTTDGADWVFTRATTPLVEAVGERGRYTLELVSLKDYAYRELPVERFGVDHLKAAGAAQAVAQMARPVVWMLAYELDGVPLARASGRRLGRDGLVEAEPKESEARSQ